MQLMILGGKQKRITDGQEEEELGIIPSKSRVEKKRTCKTKTCEF